MPSTRDIRRRIRSVKNTAQITKAMQMVAAAKMRKAQQAALAGRPYAALMSKVMAEVSRGEGDFSHPLMEARTGSMMGVIVVSTDKGLAGALNSNLAREVVKLNRDTVFISAGRKASQFLSRTKRKLAAEFTYKDAPLFSEARAISKFAQDLFLKGDVDRVDILFSNFLSTLNQKPEFRRLLPIGDIRTVVGDIQPNQQEQATAGGATEFIFEPNAEQVLGAMLPHYLNYQVYQILLEAKASEHSARMVAMKNATDNAQQLIKDLTLEYNKLRQNNITRELLEIASAAMALA